MEKQLPMLFGKKGYKIVLNGSKNKTALEQTKIEFLQQGIDCIAVLADVSKYEQCQVLLVK